MFDKLLGKMTDGIKDDFKEEMEFLQVEAMEKLLPMAKKFAPKIEKEAKAFIEKNNCMVVIKQEKNGDLSCSILKRDLTLITSESPEVKTTDDLFVKDEKTGKRMQYSLNDLVQFLTEGALDAMMSNKPKELK